MALTDNIVAYYKFDGDATDSVGSLDGSVSNVSFGSSYGKINEGAHFGASSTNNISLGTSSSLNLSNFSISVWVKAVINSPAYRQTIASKSNTWSNGKGFNLGFADGDDNITLFIGKSYTNYTLVSDLTNYTSDNTWFHLVLTVNGTTAKGYINGVERGSITILAYSSSSDAYRIGIRGDNTDYFRGDMDEYGIWSRALTSTEVGQLYNSGSGLQYPFTTGATFLPQMILT